MSDDSSDLRFDSRPYIECDGCGKENPPKRCARCSSAFYCSAECQKQHWKSHKKSCKPIEIMSGALASFSSAEIDSNLDPINMACGICLEEPIKKKIVLKECRHAFCFSCLKAWQGFRKVGDNEAKWCPFCRQDIEKSVVEEALEKATVSGTRALLLDEFDDRRKALFESAVAEVETILEVDAKHTVALGMKAQILTHLRPSEAIILLQQTLELDAIGAKEREGPMARLEMARDALDAGDPFTADAIMRSLETQYGTVESWPSAIGVGPYRLFPVRIALAEAYEAAERWKDAQCEYTDMFDTVFKKPNSMSSDPDLASHLHRIACGISRCYFRLGDYKKAIFTGQQAVSMDRSHPGVHKLVALPQHSLARKLGDAQRGEPGFAQMYARTSTTIGDAIRTMHRGHIYEAPWDNVNKQANKDFLSQLMAEAAIAAFSARFGK